MSKITPDKFLAHAHFNTAASSSRPEEWLESIGAEFVDVWLYCRHPATGVRTFELERLVDDHDTFFDVLAMRMSSRFARHALWDAGGRWALVDRRTGDTRSYPTREAAEMVAIHHG
mgnify:CR=1 FL=1